MKSILFGLAFATSCFSSLAGAVDMFRAVVDDKACYATVYSNNEILMPSHCLSLPYDSVSIEKIGTKRIESIRDYPNAASADLFQLTSERMLIVRLAEKAFDEPDLFTMKTPRPGQLDNIDATGSSCKVIYIEREKGFMAYQCQSWHGQSGRLVYQDGIPVGFHLGRLKSKGLAIAVLDKGPTVDLHAEFGSDFEAEKIKVSCCKKFNNAVNKVGEIIQGGVDTTGKLIENAKDEMKRLEDDIKVLPKVFSTEYIQEKTVSIKGPKLPEFKVSKVKWPELNVEFVGIPDRWFKKAGKRWDQAMYWFKELGKAAEVVWEELKNIKLGTPNLCQGCEDPPPRDICSTSATQQEKRQCIKDLEKELRLSGQEKLPIVEEIRPWLKDQKAKVGVE